MRYFLLIFAVAVALSIIGFVVYVMARGFGTDPHEVPFLLTGKKAPPFTIKRLEFKIGEGEWADTSMVADEVQVKFKLALTGLGPL